MYVPPVAMTAAASMCNTAVITMYARTVVCIQGDCYTKEVEKRGGGSGDGAPESWRVT